MKYLSLFSGIDAVSVAWEPLDFQAMAFAEIEPFPSAVLAHHYPSVPNLGDITKVDWTKWKEENGSPDIMVAGSPCQAFSVAGKRRSLEDARGNLTLFTADLVRYLEPKVFLWENVPGVLNTKDNAFGCLLAELAGADEPLVPVKRWTNAGVVVGTERKIAWRVLDAQYFGVAQRRRRVFLVACPLDGCDPTEILFESESVRRNTAPSREPREGTTAGTTDRTGSSSGEPSGLIAMSRDELNGKPLYDVANPCTATDCKGAQYIYREGGFGQFVQEEIGGTIKATGGVLAGGSESLVITPTPLVMAPSFSKRPGQQIANRQDDTCYAITTGEPPRVLEAQEPFRKSRRAQTANDHETWVPAETSNTLNSFDVGDVRATEVVVEAFAQNQLGEVRTGEVSGTINTNSNPSGRNAPLVHVSPSVRRLTPLECERLQGFPDNWTQIPWKGKAPEDCPDGPRYKACGNSMAVPVMRWLGSRIDAVCNNKQFLKDIPNEFRLELESRKDTV